MAFDLDFRCCLEFDSEFRDVADKFIKMEESLNEDCDQMTAILDDITATQRCLELCRQTGRSSVASVVEYRLRTLKTLYDVLYEGSMQKSQQLEFLEAHREQKDAALLRGCHEDLPC